MSTSLTLFMSSPLQHSPHKKKIIRRYTSLREDIEMSICTRIQTDTPVSPTDKDRKIEREVWKLSAYRMRSIMEANSCFPPPEKIKTTKKQKNRRHDVYRRISLVTLAACSEWKMGAGECSKSYFLFLLLLSSPLLLSLLLLQPLGPYGHQLLLAHHPDTKSDGGPPGPCLPCAPSTIVLGGPWVHRS